MDIKKIVTILNYLAIKITYLTKLKAIKLLYFIDKAHLIRFGRFITNDDYVKLHQGPVHSYILYMINDPALWIRHERDLNYLRSNISFSNCKNRTIKSLKDPDLNELSLSEKKVIDTIISKYGHLHVGQLIELSHKEYFWDILDFNEHITAEKMVHNDISEEQKKELLLVLKEYKEEERILAAIN